MHAQPLKRTVIVTVLQAVILPQGAREESSGGKHPNEHLADPVELVNVCEPDEK